jgi:hypothetical protein
MGTSRTPNGEGEGAGEPARAAGARAKLGSESETVVLATFANRHAAERMLTSLGRDFRRKARKDEAAAFLITGNADGSFSLGQSRVLTASGVAAAGAGVAVATLAGLMGMMSALRGGRTVVQAARQRGTHADPEAQRFRDMLAEAGPHASVLVVRCADPGDAAVVVTVAAERARETWHGSLAEAVAGLDQAAGKYDWLLAALDQPSKAGG